MLTDRETEIARECLARGDKPRALLALRRKKYQESLLSKTDAQLIELEKLTSSVEFALVQKDVLFGLSQGTQVLKAIHKEMGGLEGVEKMMGENEEARAYQEVWLACYPFPLPPIPLAWIVSDDILSDAAQEISRMIAGQMSNQDEDEVEDELEQLEQQVRGPLPKAPTGPLPKAGEETAQKTRERARARAKERAPIAA